MRSPVHSHAHSIMFEFVKICRQSTAVTVTALLVAELKVHVQRRSFMLC